VRRLAPVLLAITAVLATAAPAHADHHMLRVSEIALSAGGAQFVELREDNPFGEPFPDALMPYRLVVFDGAGTRVGGQDLPPTLLRGPSTPILISTAPQNDAHLNVALPAGSGQVCFTRTTAETRVHCMSYGCPAAPLAAEYGNQVGAAPADGQSLQRLTSGVALGAATPDADNAATGSAACTGAPAPPGGPGNPGGPGGTPPTEDHTAPSAKLSGKRRQDVDKLAVRVTLSEAGSVRVSGTVSVPGVSKVLRFKSVTRSVRANVRVTLKPKLSRKAKRAVKKALRRGRRLKARLTISARDQAGNRSTARKTVALAD
jgi:hypothetical protein